MFYPGAPERSKEENAQVIVSDEEEQLPGTSSNALLAVPPKPKAGPLRKAKSLSPDRRPAMSSNARLALPPKPKARNRIR